MYKIIGIALLLSSVTLAGCKVQLSSPTGGSITTASGNYACAANAACPAINVNDIFFDETFIARPAAGYEFAGWKKRQRGLCGGSTKDCRLFTSGFAGNDDLLGFLARPNEVFYLEPVFTRSAGGSGDARRCFNSTLMAVNTTVVASYRTTDASGAVVPFDYDQVITGGATFEGKSALKATTNTRARGAAPSTSKAEAYFQPQSTQFRVLEYGVEVESFTPESSDSRVVFAPQQLERYDLSAGQSYEQRYTVNLRTRVRGFTLNESNTVDRRTTFVGIEPVTVPAGQFQACRFQTRETGSAGTQTNEEWFGVGNGMLLKSTADGDSTVLLNASINGAAL
tara:strand:+ start:31340 stop:32356 length:1017 start_codon:yes stop_codon:yes gene_type:complete